MLAKAEVQLSQQTKRKDKLSHKLAEGSQNRGTQLERIMKMKKSYYFQIVTIINQLLKETTLINLQRRVIANSSMERSTLVLK